MILRFSNVACDLDYRIGPAIQTSFRLTNERVTASICELGKAATELIA